MRERYFTARTPQTKEKYRKEDERLRGEILGLLQKGGWPSEITKQLASWNPYDQNTAANFFDPEWMFGLKEGFDVVIGNPPHGHTINENKKYFIQHYISAEGKHEVFKYFIEKGLSLLAPKATLSYITSDTWTSLGYFKKLRKLIYTNYQLRAISKSLYNVFETATVDTNIFFIANEKPVPKYFLIEGDLQSRNERVLDINDEYVFNLKEENSIIKLIKDKHKTIEDFCEVWQGLIAYGSKSQTRTYTSNQKETKLHRKLVYGRDIAKYKISWSGEYLKYGEWLHRPRPSYIFTNQKILVQRIRNPQLKERLICAIDNDGFINGTGLSNILLKKNISKPSLYYILCILNSSLISYWFNFYFIDVNIKPEQLRKVPIKLSDKKDTFNYCCNYITTAKKYEKIFSDFFEHLIDAMVYELYLPEEITAAGANVLCHLQNLPDIQPLLEKGETEKALKTIEKVYKELSNPIHPVSVAMQKMQEIEEVKIIEGKN